MRLATVADASLASGPGRSHELFYGMVGTSPAMQVAFEQIERFAGSSIPVLILGESGTGKELVARAIWQMSTPERPFVVVDCAAVTPTLLETELFGHERGAFTHAVRRHKGYLAQADGGILFLDEIAELSPYAQTRILRVIETHEYRPVGGETTHRSRFRLIAATHRDLETMVERAEFRHDLLHRLGAARITMPPLRGRVEDLPLLAEHFLASFRSANGGPVRFSREALEFLLSEEWPGNVRQLRNVIEAGAASARGATVEARHLRAHVPPGFCEGNGSGSFPTLAETLRRAEGEAVRRALERAGEDRARAARLLGISPATLYRKLASLHGILDSGSDPQI